MSAERTPVFGLTESTRKPVNRAASELTQAINALDTHDRDERSAMRNAAGNLARAGNENPGPERDLRAEQAARLESIATDLRLARGQLLDHLKPLRDPLLAVAEEAHALLPADALRWWDPEPGPLEPAPQALRGIEDKLRLVDWVDILNRNLEWARRMSRTWAVTALGPCYLLSTTVEHPTDEAAQLRTRLERARDELTRFINR